MPSRHRHLLVGGGVVLFHAAALWALQGGLVRRTVEVIVPVAVLSDFITPPAPRIEPPAPVPAPPVPDKPRPVRKAEPRPPAPAPRPLAVPDPSPAPSAPVAAPAPPAPLPPIEAPVSQAPAPAPAPAPVLPRVELPSTSADYLQNPKPPYPPMSKRLGEQGKVLVRVLIGADGLPQKAELSQSSGFERLDQAALKTVMAWRYVSGRRGGIPEPMWFNVPINFVLE